MPDEASSAAYEQLRNELRQEIRDEIRSALRELRTPPTATGASEFELLGPLGGRCFIIIAVPVGCEHTAMRRFARLGDETSARPDDEASAQR